MKNSDEMNFKELYERLEISKTKLNENLVMSDEKKKKTLHQRATVLAKAKEKTIESELMDVVFFKLADEIYAIESQYITEVLHLRELTEIPGTPPFVLGVINIRGDITSVIDLKRLFDLPEKGISDLTKVIVIKSSGMELGILTEDVVGALTIKVSDIDEPLPTLTGIRLDFLRGITSDRVTVLSAPKLLRDSSIIVNYKGI